MEVNQSESRLEFSNKIIRYVSWCLFSKYDVWDRRKKMTSLIWSLSVGLSVGALIAGILIATQNRHL